MSEDDWDPEGYRSKGANQSVAGRNGRSGAPSPEGLHHRNHRSRSSSRHRSPPQGTPRKTPIDLNPFKLPSWWKKHESVRPWGPQEPESTIDSPHAQIMDPVVGIGATSSNQLVHIPQEQEDRLEQTRSRVSLAVHAVLGYSGKIGHDLLVVGTEVLPFAPIPGLGEAAKLLLAIWDSVKAVESNRLACLRLTERCANILLSIRQEIHEAGNVVDEELAVPLRKLVESFSAVELLLRKHAARPFLERYLRHGEIIGEIEFCNIMLHDSLDLFSNATRIRILRLSIMTSKRQQEILNLLTSQSHPGSRSASPHGRHRSSTPHRSPPLDPFKAANGMNDVLTIQNENDHKLDEHDLLHLIQSSLSTSSDDQVRQVLQVLPQDTLDAIKVLQRTLERINRLEGTRDQSLADSMISEPASALLGESITEHAEVVVEGERGALHLSGMDMVSSPVPADAKRKPTQISTNSIPFERDRTPSPALNKEFLECNIEALKRLCGEETQTLPKWTITKFEIDIHIQNRIGVGAVSEVYTGTWKSKTVAIKILHEALPKLQKMFIHEVNIWKTLRHINVLPLLGASSAHGSPPYFLVSPYLKNGDIVRYLKGLGSAPWDPIKMMYEVACGIEYLHKMKVLHGDLKGSNILIDDNLRCVITDFGQSDMKDEIYQLSGTTPPRGTLRWRAPELLDGEGTGRTFKVDVYAYAMVCLEILQKGDLPWLGSNEEAIWSLVMARRRPHLRTTDVELKVLIERCWAHSASNRPEFSEVAEKLRALRGNPQPSPLPPLLRPYETDDDLFGTTSPDMRPSEIPHGEEDASSQTIDSGVFSVQQIVNPSTTERPANAAEWHQREAVVTNVPPSLNDTKKRSSTMMTHDSVGIDAYSRPNSPPPPGLVMAQRRDERRYRLNIKHDFHKSLTLPFWSPAPLAVGAVGYLSKPSGTFVTLFNAYDPSRSSNGRIKNMTRLEEFGTVKIDTVRQDLRSVTKRRIDAIHGLLVFRGLHQGLFSQGVSNRFTFPLKAHEKQSFICTDSTVYRFMEDLTVPKAWFKANVDKILEAYGHEHGLLREYVFVIVGVLEASDYALFVDHGHETDGNVHFNVYTPPKAGQSWGVFATDTDTPPTSTSPPGTAKSKGETPHGSPSLTASKFMAAGPHWDDDDIPAEEHWTATKVSKVNFSSNWDTVLAARLKFRTDSDEPTSSK